MHNFDDSGYDDIDESIKDTEADKVALELDKKGKEEVDLFINDELLIDNLSREPSSMKVFDAKKFYTSPLPSIISTNTSFILNQLKLNVAKDNYYSFEIVKYNLISKEIVNINDLSIYVTRNKYVFPNVGGNNDYFFKYKNNVIYGTAALGYNPPPGKYTIIVKSKSNPDWKGVSTSFNLLKRQVPEIPKGFSIVNMEYTVFLKNIKVQGIDGKLGNYKNIAKWVKFMGADAFWMLVAQTTGWHKTITPTEPWVKGGFKNLDLLAPVMKKNGIKVGAYIMSYFTPANGKKKAGYEASLGYDGKTDKIEDSLHISLNDEKRIQDIIALAKKFNANPQVDFIGMDFIRTGRADGYEMGPLVVEDMNIKTPSAYDDYSYLEKVKWFAKRVENLKNRNYC